MTTVIATSIGSAAVTYEIIGVLGYLTFGDNVTFGLLSASTERLTLILGWSEYYSRLSLDLALRCFWPTGNCHPGFIFISVASPTVSQLL
jgi:amino acid permease